LNPPVNKGEFSNYNLTPKPLSVSGIIASTGLLNVGIDNANTGTESFYKVTLQASYVNVPEPATLPLAAISLLGLAAIRRKKRSNI